MGRRMKPRRLFAPQRGFLRVGGFYGRYAGAPGVGRYGQRPELKFRDIIVAPVVPAVAGTITSPSVNLIPQGVTESERVGRKCTLKAVSFHFQMELPDTTVPGQTSDRVRIIVYLDKQANGATAAVLNILETATINSFFNLEESSRFRLLYNRFHDISSQSGGVGATFASAELLKTVNWGTRCSKPIEFSGVTGAIGEIRSNNVGVLMISEKARTVVGYTVRIRFQDS